MTLLTNAKFNVQMHTDFRKGSVQYEWINKDLMLVERKVTPWVIFAGKRTRRAASHIYKPESLIVRFVLYIV